MNVVIIAKLFLKGADGIVTTKYAWQPLTAIPATQVDQVAHQNNVSPLLATLLCQRGLTTPTVIDRFLHPQLSQLHDPLLLHDMQAAVERISTAIMNGEKITVYGDYDVDGLTSTTIMYEALASLGADVDIYIPNRFSDGYGPSRAAYQRLIAQGTQLIVTVDNGVSGHDEIKFAHEQGVDVVVTDHHELPQQLPEDAAAIVHPRYPGSQYPFGDLSGAGVAFKVATALLEEVPVDCLDLVALGTVCDLVSLRDENRVLVALGLQVLQNDTRPGIRALCQVAYVNQQQLNTTDIGFRLGPRLNSLGRLGDAQPGVQLLHTLDPNQATQLADFVQTQNEKRRQYVDEISEMALTMAQSEEYYHRKTLVLAHKNWHEGVLGIVASRIVEATGKPTLVLNISDDGQTAKGSGRSVPSLHLFNALNSERDHMLKFGGHHMAVGLSVATAQIATIAAALEAAAQDKNDIPTQPQLPIALQLPVTAINEQTYHDIQQLAPFGVDNEEPLVQITRPQVANVKALGDHQQHLKLLLQQQQFKVNAIGFNLNKPGYDWYHLPFNLVGYVTLNHWHDQQSIQLQLKDIQPLMPTIIDKRHYPLNTTLFNDDAVYVFFNEKIYQQLHPFLQNHQAVMADNYAVIAKAAQITFVDEPTNLSDLQKLLQQQHADVITLIFYTKHHLASEGMPTIAQCRQVLRYCMQHPSLPKDALAQIANYLQIKKSILIFIIQVFLEVQFVKIEKDMIITQLPLPKDKLDIQATAVYQQRQQQITIDQLLFNSSLQQLIKQLFSYATA
ncbi:MAG: single-stranded-DNA-specific exonuclease RecJ [Candidatus Paralactobacillus gallistercoris]|uniref:Single-stranded-DNA-specific exonuclease RecJ n=1 Tax=Candidatus Paralactobacillus gallistercoris TaxID=2838724 RepID=A0A948TIC9_9LACO|nr:single-stranded-DNA-specific exonuclease RecJ [Candidatus Paralactobacillus gallistercoris]